MNGTAFDLIDSTTKLFIPRRLDFGIPRIETGQQFFGEARTLFRRKRVRLGRQFGNEVRHSALQKPLAAVYAGSFNSSNEPRPDAAVISPSTRAGSAPSMPQWKRQPQLPPSTPGTFMRWALPRPSTSCSG